MPRVEHKEIGISKEGSIIKPNVSSEMIAKLAQEKSAEDIVIMDMTLVSGVCDYFVIASATSQVRARTIAENVLAGMKNKGVRALHREGLREGQWVLLDFGDVIFHVFQHERRAYYDLEHLWGDAPRRNF